ncbi:hypothetical protein G6F61_005816 [Rhizopus arrhizus]|nr:hypothetical protein G6F61_005816 [Rhizopus arrhizus]
MLNNRSTISTTYSTHSVSDVACRGDQVFYLLAKIYFQELQTYLSSVLAKEASEGVSVTRSTARQKLSKLNNLQFHELATDVYDELMRRTAEGHRSFLPVREDFHPRRNQARQKLATLISSKFRDLSSDVYHELKRRYPLLSTEPSSGAVDDSNEAQAVTDDLESLMADLGNMVKPSDDPPASAVGSMEDARYKYELKIALMAKQIKSLELTLNSAEHLEIKNRYEELSDKYNKLLNQHTEQQTAVQDVKSEIRILIDELKNLSEKNERLRIEKEQTEQRVRSITEEANAWRAKYESIRVKSMPSKVAKDVFWIKPTAQGAIDQTTLMEYQRAMDTLMEASRSSSGSDVLTSVRSIVMTCKTITTEVEAHELSRLLAEPDQSSLDEIKKRFSTALSSLLSAATGFAHGLGITPVSLLDAAAITLTMTIVDLVKLLGLGSKEGRLLNPHQLSRFLKNQTDHMVAAVQDLLSALRTNDKNLFDVITPIITIVSNLITTTKQTLQTTEGSRYRSKGMLILKELEKHNEKMMEIRKDSKPTNTAFKRSLAQESHEIAKHVKELVSLLEM